ncbi:MAG: rod shape-determining protein RodA, partial [Eggerthellaceae bacterium]|nr:rod shape-determining protein RodA [Eggerthellaceae bacterium]
MPVQPQLSTVRSGSGASRNGSSSSLLGRIVSAIKLPLVIVATLLVLYCLLVVFSAVSADEDYTFSRQLAGVAIGLVVMALVWAF